MTLADARRILEVADGVLGIPSFASTDHAHNWRRQRDLARTVVALRARLGDGEDTP